MPAQNGFAIAYGVSINGALTTIMDDAATPATFYVAKLVQSADLREEAIDSQEYKDCGGVVRTKLLNGTKRVITLTLIPTNGSAGASGGIATAEDDVKLPAPGDVLTLANFQGPSGTTGEINGDWTYQGGGRVITANDDAVRIELELEQYYDAGGTVVDLSVTT